MSILDKRYNQFNWTYGLTESVDDDIPSMVNVYHDHRKEGADHETAAQDTLAHYNAASRSYGDTSGIGERHTKFLNAIAPFRNVRYDLIKDVGFPEF